MDTTSATHTKMSLTNGLSHVGLSVPDIHKTTNFLSAVGFKQVGGVEDYPSIFLSDGSVLITVWKTKVEDPAPFDRRANVGLHHLAIKVPSMEALNKVYAIVKEMSDVKIEFPPQDLPGMPMTIFMCYEPCGNRVEFTYHHA